MKILPKEICVQIIGGKLQNGDCTGCHSNSNKVVPFFSFATSDSTFQSSFLACQEMACNKITTGFWVFKAWEDGTFKVESGECAIGFAPIDLLEQMTSSNSLSFSCTQ